MPDYPDNKKHSEDSQALQKLLNEFDLPRSSNQERDDIIKKSLKYLIYISELLLPTSQLFIKAYFIQNEALGEAKNFISLHGGQLWISF